MLCSSKISLAASAFVVSELRVPTLSPHATFSEVRRTVAMPPASHFIHVGTSCRQRPLRNRSNTPTGLDVATWTRFAKSIDCSIPAIRRWWTRICPVISTRTHNLRAFVLVAFFGNNCVASRFTHDQFVHFST